MGKFERKVKRSLQAERQPFADWFAENAAQFGGFSAADGADVAVGAGGLAARRRKRTLWLTAAAFLLGALCALLCFLPWMLGSRQPAINPGVLYLNMRLDEAQQQALVDENACLKSVSITSGTELVRQNDSVVVSAIVEGVIEAEGESYYVTVEIEYDTSYDEMTKFSYNSLSQYASVNGYSVLYDGLGTDSGGMVWYKMRTERAGQRLYWQIRSRSESLQPLIAAVCGEAGASAVQAAPEQRAY